MHADSIGSIEFPPSAPLLLPVITVHVLRRCCPYIIGDQMLAQNWTSEHESAVSSLRCRPVFSRSALAQMRATILTMSILFFSPPFFYLFLSHHAHLYGRRLVLR